MRAECIWNSQPPPSARPRTAATTGTSEYLMRWLVAWKLATIASNSSILPACKQAMRARQVGTGGERLLRLPDHQALEVASRRSSMACCSPSSTPSLTVFILVLKLTHRDAVAVVPHAHAVVLEHGLAGREALTQHRIGEALALVDRQCSSAAACAFCAGLKLPSAPCTPSRPSNTQAGSGALLMALPATMSSAIQFGDLLPAGGLPGFERAERPAVAPADREVDVARGVGDVGQVVGAVVEQVAEHRPQELRLRMLAGAQLRRTSRPGS